MKFLGQLACLLLVILCFSPHVAHAADYAPDLVCYNMDNTTTPPTPLCAANEYTEVCTSHPLTHLASIGGVMRCLDNAPIIAPGLLDAWYPEQSYYSGYTWYTGCTVPNTFPYTGAAAVPANSCIGTTTTPQDDSVGWFCEDNVNYHPEYGSVGYKCVLNVPIVCPGIPPHHLQQITTPTGYNAYECVPNVTTMPTCSSTETLTLIFTTPTNQYQCIQTWPWDKTTLPQSPPPPAPTTYACPANESLISDGAPAPSTRYGCALNDSCPSGQHLTQTSPPGALPLVSTCMTPVPPTCPSPTTETALPDTLVNPVAYYCCPNGNTLSINRATTPATYGCVAPVAPPVCPPGQQLATVTTTPYYICSPPDPTPCLPGQNYQTSSCVPNSTHMPTCTSSQTQELTAPVSTQTCVPTISPSCPPGQVINYTSVSPVTYTCVASTADPVCTTGTHLVLAPPTTPYTPGTCVADTPGTPPTCAAGEILNTISVGPPATYSCVLLPVPPPCPPGQTPRMVTMTPTVTYACSSEGN